MRVARRAERAVGRLPRDGRASPLRTCVGCRSVRPQAELIRVALDAAGAILMNPRRPQGRGAYLCPSQGCLEQALHRKALGRALRRELTEMDSRAVRQALAAEIGRRLAAVPAAEKPQ